MSESMFPAPAGMSPPPATKSLLVLNVPRTRGDEPASIMVDGVDKGCSPHPRG